MFFLPNVFEFSEGSSTSVSTSILPYTPNIYFNFFYSTSLLYQKFSVFIFPFISEAAVIHE